MGDLITKETFEGYPVESKLSTLYDVQLCVLKSTEQLDKRLDAIEQGVTKDRRKELAIAGTMGAASGLIGGIATVWSYVRFWK